LSVNEGFNSAFEKKCFNSFVSGGSKRLALFQPSTGQFWISLLPQLSQIYLPLRHALIALVLINEPLFMPEVGAIAQKSQPDLLSDVMKHFNRSIRTFAQEMHTLSIEARLSCCFMYTALTIYMYRVGASSVHMLAAYRFLKVYERQIEVGSVLASAALNDTLIPTLKRLFIDAATFSDALTNMTGITPYEDWVDDILYIPSAFPTLEAAYEALGNLLKYAVALLLGHFKFGSKPHLQLRKALERYLIILDDSSLDKYGGEEVSAERKRFFRKDLGMHHRAVQILCKCIPGTMEQSLWASTADFQYVLQQVSELMVLDPLGPSKVTLGWTPPLFLVATRCRVSKLRREALALLHDLERVERAWSTCIAHAIAEFVVNLEEAANIEHHNPMSFTYIRLLSIRFDPDEAVATATYEKQIDQRSIGTESSTIILRSPVNTLMGANGANLPDPVLRASGYTGLVLWTPRMECHCFRDPNWLKHRGKMIEEGSIEEVVVGVAGMRTELTGESHDRRRGSSSSM